MRLFFLLIIVPAILLPGQLFVCCADRLNPLPIADLGRSTGPGWSATFAGRCMSGSNHENRSLSAAGPNRQLHPRDRSFDHGASIVAPRATALARRASRDPERSSTEPKETALKQTVNVEGQRAAKPSAATQG